MLEGLRNEEPEFVKAVAHSSGTEITLKDLEKIVDTVFLEMGRAVSGNGRFVWPGFGTFTVKDRAARQGRNPRTGESMSVDASKTVGFKPAPGLKDSL